MILADHQIINWASSGGVRPFDQLLVNPTSIDIRCGDQAMVEGSDGLEQMFLFDYDEESPFLLKPGQFALLSVLEHIDLSEPLGGVWSLSAKALLKSGRAREGLSFVDAGWVDCGYKGKLTLAVRNNLQMGDQKLWPGKRIAQLVLFSHQKPMDSYDGNYQGYTSVTASVGHVT